MDPAEDLEELEITLVDQRRQLVSVMTNRDSPRGEQLERLVDIQRSIDAVKSAIEDEKSRARSVYEDPATTV